MPTIQGDVATLLGEDHTAGDPVALWLLASQPILTDAGTGRTGGKIRIPVASNGTFSVADVPATSGGFPTYQLQVDSLSLRRAGQNRGMTTGSFPLTTDRDLTWIVDNYVPVTVVTTQVYADVQAAAALGATNDTSVASFMANPASATYAAAATKFAPLSPINVGNLPAFSIIAHRGGSLVAPEESLEAYRTALAAGADTIEVDLYQLADGALAVHHDSTVDRTTTGTGNVADHTAQSWKMLSHDPSTYLGGGWADGTRPLLFSEVLSEFGNRVMLKAEVKTPVAAATAAALATTFGVSPNALIIASGNLVDCQAIVAAGYPAEWVGTVATCPVATAITNGIDFLSVSDPTAPYCTAAHAAGIKVSSWTINRRSIATAHQALGVDGVYTDDPAYLLSTKADRNTDPFGLQTWYPGMIPMGAYGTSATLPNRGKFWTPDYWGYDTAPDSVSNHFVVQGYLKVPNPGAFTMDFKFRYDSVFGGDLARWGAVAIMSTDAAYTGAGVAGNDGYQLMMRANGQLDIYRVPGGAAVLLGSLAAASGTDLVAGADTPYRITVTATQITIARTDIPADTVTVTNNAMRSGAVIHLGRAGMACRFKDITVA